MAPAMNSAARQFQAVAMKMTLAGASAEPRCPEKVWMEKARPMREGSIEALRMA